MLLNIYINLFYKTIKIDYVVRIIIINSNKNLWAFLNNTNVACINFELLLHKNFWETTQNLRIFTLHSQTCNDRFLLSGVASTEPCPGLTF